MKYIAVGALLLLALAVGQIFGGITGLWFGAFCGGLVAKVLHGPRGCPSARDEDAKRKAKFAESVRKLREKRLDTRPE